ncbi:Prephenate dehydratase-domain-containing protein [Scheffersomyces coipomensis]|uniref:Prephenate dehydratase-domain-containing protein n=1 Tax=Scheffersomyces coipomensis TaxID=1788519 RepID=UPI00315CF6F2
MTIKVAFLGPEGTYTHKAVLQQFRNDSSNQIEIYPKKLIDDCFTSIDSREVDYAVVPVENSTNGQVVFTYDLLRDWFIPTSTTSNTSEMPTPPNSAGSGISSQPPKFKIVAEQFVSIQHNFLTNAKDLSKIKTIYSHPQVWTQVSQFFKSNKLDFSKVAKVDATSTSKAAEFVYHDKSNTTACIASNMSAELYNLPIVYSNIEDNSKNTTRFLVLGYEPAPVISSPTTPPKQTPDVTSVILTLNHDDPGALCDVLVKFKNHNINLSSISSRPSHLKQWQYVFFIEMLADLNNNLELSHVIDDISTSCQTLVVLGSFKRSWRYYS